MRDYIKCQPPESFQVGHRHVHPELPNLELVHCVQLSLPRIFYLNLFCRFNSQSESLYLLMLPGSLVPQCCIYSYMIIEHVSCLAASLDLSVAVCCSLSCIDYLSYHLSDHSGPKSVGLATGQKLLSLDM